MNRRNGKASIAVARHIFPIENGPFRMEDRESAPHALEGKRKIPI
jgi:hypothetical protein